MLAPQLFIIDDDKIYHFLVNRLLDDIQVKSKLVGVNKFFSAAEALAFLDSQETPERTVILLDLNMPEMTGFDFLDALSERTAVSELCRVYIVTSSVNQSDREKADQYAEVVDFIVKPIQKSTLTNVIYGEMNGA